MRNTWTYTLDPFGRATRITDPENYASDRSFDEVSNLTRTRNEIDESAATWIENEYDTRGNVTTTVVRESPMGEGNATVSSYSSANDLLTRSDANGVVTLKGSTIRIKPPGDPPQDHRGGSLVKAAARWT